MPSFEWRNRRVVDQKPPVVVSYSLMSVCFYKYKVSAKFCMLTTVGDLEELEAGVVFDQTGPKGLVASGPGHASSDLMDTAGMPSSVPELFAMLRIRPAQGVYLEYSLGPATPPPHKVPGTS